MFHKTPTVVVDRFLKRTFTFKSQNDAFRATDTNKSTGQKSLDTGRTVGNRFEFYTLDLKPLNK